MKKRPPFFLRKLKQIAFLFLNILFAPFVWVLHRLGYRIFGLKHIQAIGHLVLEPDLYLRKVALGLAPSHKMILLAPSARLTPSYPEKLVGNQALVAYWKRYFIVFQSPWIYATLSHLRVWKRLFYSIDDYVMNYKDPSPVYSLYHHYKGAPFLQLTPLHQEAGKNALQQLGLPPTAWFICFHARATDFLSPEEDRCFSCRNWDVNSLYKALQAIHKQGGYAIRLGDPKSPPLDKKFQTLSVIDYTKSPLHADWMDLFLASQCRFFLGGTSGISHLPSVLGKPCAIVNAIPFCHLPFSPHDLFIPKLYFSQPLNRLLHFEEILHLSCAHGIHLSEFEAEGITLIDNEEEEIEALVVEMLDRLEGKDSLTPEQKKLRAQFNSLIEPRHFCYGVEAKMGTSFLTKYQFLLT